jgi:hypothetical protein
VYEAQKVVYAVVAYIAFNFTRTKSYAPAHSLMAPPMVLPHQIQRGAGRQSCRRRSRSRYQWHEQIYQTRCYRGCTSYDDIQSALQWPNGWRSAV